MRSGHYLSIHQVHPILRICTNSCVDLLYVLDISLSNSVSDYYSFRTTGVVVISGSTNVPSLKLNSRKYHQYNLATALCCHALHTSLFGFGLFKPWVTILLDYQTAIEHVSTEYSTPKHEREHYPLLSFLIVSQVNQIS